MPRLELTWIGKDQHPRLEPRILLENPDLRCGTPSADGAWQGMLIHGDNLLALKALEADYAGQVKCIYIDPPYNTGSAFTHYDDGLEHSLWLSLIRDRLVLLRNLLREDGSIWISIDDNECHYLKVLCDEVFGRGNFVANFIWKKSYGGGSKSKHFVGLHEHILCYSKNFINLPEMYLPPDENAVSKYYKHKDSKYESRGPYRLQPLATTSMDDRPNLKYSIVLPNGEEIWPEKQWQWSKERTLKAIENNELVIKLTSEGYSVSYKQYLKDESGEERKRKPMSIIEDHYTQHGTYESMELFGLNNKFAFPKPEGLIEIILQSCTHPNDLVLDSFLGSGTTAAVAHKMGRRWIGIELGKHAYTHCVPRLRKVVRGQDPGGISKAVNWQGSGGFRFYTLAPTLLQRDQYGQWVINPEYNGPMLAAAVAKHEGFHYAPDPEIWWKQARSAEKDYLLVTTQYVNRPLLDGIRAGMAEGESLLVCCKAFDAACARLYPEISVKKIPNMLVDRCEFGRDDYSLHIVNLPNEPAESQEEELPPAAVGKEIGAETGEKTKQGKLFE